LPRTPPAQTRAAVIAPEASPSSESLTPFVAGRSGMFDVANTLRFLSASFEGKPPRKHSNVEDDLLRVGQGSNGADYARDAHAGNSGPVEEASAAWSGAILEEKSMPGDAAQRPGVSRTPSSATAACLPDSNMPPPAVQVSEDAPAAGRKSALENLKGRIRSRQINILRRSRCTSMPA
jgi:hypothetical protein